MKFKDFFKTEMNEAVQTSSKTEVKNIKIKDDFETELRKLYKIKMVINTAFGVQIDFYKKPEKEEILNIIDLNVKFKGNSIFIEF